MGLHLFAVVPQPVYMNMSDLHALSSTGQEDGLELKTPTAEDQSSLGGSSASRRAAGPLLGELTLRLAIRDARQAVALVERLEHLLKVRHAAVALAQQRAHLRHARNRRAAVAGAERRTLWHCHARR